MKLDAIPKHVFEDIRRRGFSDKEIEAMSARDAFNEYCMWHGLIGWGPTLWSVATDLKEADQ